MSISDLSGRLSAIMASPRLAALQAKLETTLSLVQTPIQAGVSSQVASKLTRVDELAESNVTRQSVESPPQTTLKTPHAAAEAGLRANGSVLTHLSKTATLLTNLAATQGGQPQPRATLPILPSRSSVLEAPPSYAAPLALGLQSMVQESGLFYEYHLLSWYEGQYPKERLALEPQAQWISKPLPEETEAQAKTMQEAARPPVSTDGATEKPAAKPSTEARPLPAMATYAPDGHVERATNEHRVAFTSGPGMDAAAGNPAGETAASSTLPQEAAKIIAQQLLLMDRPSFEWSVDVWPGQAATFLIEEDSPRTADADAVWSTHIKLDFPNLGPMEIALTLDTQGLRLRFVAEDETKASTLINQRGQCAERLASTGCKLREFSIGTHHAGT